MESVVGSLGCLNFFLLSFFKIKYHSTIFFLLNSHTHTSCLYISIFHFEFFQRYLLPRYLVPIYIINYWLYFITLLILLPLQLNCKRQWKTKNETMCIQFTRWQWWQWVIITFSTILIKGLLHSGTIQSVVVLVTMNPRAYITCNLKTPEFSTLRYELTFFNKNKLGLSNSSNF